MRPAFAARAVAPGSRAGEEFRHGRPGPAPALSGGEAFGVEMLGNGLRRSHPRRLGGFDLDHDVPDELLDFLSPLSHSINIDQPYGMSPFGQDDGPSGLGLTELKVPWTCARGSLYDNG